jgi:hypothetical protein
MAVTIHPARGFRAQIHKIRRTSRGHAILTVVVWGHSAVATGSRALLAAGGKACHAAMLVAASPFKRFANAPDAGLLAAGRAMMGACYNLAFGLTAWAAAFQRGNHRRCVPDIPQTR